MHRQHAIDTLSSHLEILRQQFGVRSVSLFGSVARDEAGSESDLDILVEFSTVPGLFGFLDLKDYLESLFNCSVDLVTMNALKHQLREKILAEAISVH